MDLPSRRYALLVRQLAEERERKYGYKSQIARLLGVHPSYIRQIEDGEQRIGEHTIKRAVERLGLHPEYFTNEALGNEPSYRDFQIRPPAGPDRPVPAETGARARAAAHALVAHAEQVSAAAAVADAAWFAEVHDLATHVLALEPVEWSLRIATGDIRSISEERAREYVSAINDFARGLATGLSITRWTPGEPSDGG